MLQLVFEGECVEGREPRAVREAVAAALRLDERRVERLFSGRRVVLRRELSESKAHRYIARFATLGAVVRAEPSQPRRSGATAATPPAAQAPAGAAPATPAAAVAPVAVAPILGERPLAAAVADATAGVAARVQRRASRPAWAGTLLWVGIGVLSVPGAIVLGLALGPGLNALRAPEVSTLGSDAAPSAAIALREPVPAPDAPAAAAAPVTPATLPAPAAEGELAPDMSAAALQEYRQRYQLASHHKAFAISSGGGYGWQSGAASEDAARQGALERCMRSGPVGDDGCRIVDADGQWLE